MKFKRLIINGLKKSPNSRICAERVARQEYRNIRGRKRINSLTISALTFFRQKPVEPDKSPCMGIRGTLLVLG